jgi:hypothetical protein
VSRSVVTRLAGIASTAVFLTVAATLPAFAAPDPKASKAPAPSGPNPKPKLPGGVQAKLDTLLGMGMAVVIVACVAGVLICAGKLALAVRHGEGAEAAGKLGAVGFACILVGSAAGVVNYLV